MENLLSLGMPCPVMIFYKLIFLLLIAFIISCKKQGPAQTHLYTADGLEVLNGNVKEIFSGDSSKRLSSYYKYDFDENDDMTTSVEKTEGKTDTGTIVDKRQYLVSHDKKGLISAIKYTSSIFDTESPISNYSNRFEFDKGHLVTRVIPAIQHRISFIINVIHLDMQ